MKVKLYSFLMIPSVLVLLLFQSCDNGNADVEVFDSPPRIEVVKPVKFTSPNFKLKLKFYDGADASISSSPLASADYDITTLAGASVKKGNLTVSGVFTEINEPISGLAKGKYKVKINATDLNGNKVSSESLFEIIESVGIIGDAVNGWDADVNLQVSNAEADVFVLNAYTLKSGELKFRANDDWAVNWGGTSFPDGNGTQDGANIKVNPGAYDITLDASTGQYKFVKK